MKSLRYYADLILAPALSALICAYCDVTVIPFILGWLAWSFSEYAVHRWFLHSRAGGKLHITHHAHPDDTVTDTAWQVYAGLAVATLAFPAFAAGALASYAWYLYVHHCCHHFNAGIPSSLMDHHEGHHRFARRNFGVGTVLWDVLFRTRLENTP